MGNESIKQQIDELKRLIQEHTKTEPEHQALCVRWSPSGRRMLLPVAVGRCCVDRGRWASTLRIS